MCVAIPQDAKAAFVDDPVLGRQVRWPNTSQNFLEKSPIVPEAAKRFVVESGAGGGTAAHVQAQVHAKAFVEPRRAAVAWPARRYSDQIARPRRTEDAARWDMIIRGCVPLTAYPADSLPFRSLHPCRSLTAR